MARARPAELVPGTVSAIMVSIDYAPQDPEWVAQAWATLADGERAADHEDTVAALEEVERLLRSTSRRLSRLLRDLDRRH